jgi:hypothetical protein
MPLAFVDGLYPAEVEVLQTLKGEKKPGPLKIATIYEMKPETRYLISSRGGSAFDANFLAIGELTVVPIPDNFDLTSLEKKTTKQQLQILFARHLYEIERQLAPLLEAQQKLKRAVADRDDNLYVSKRPVQLGEIRELDTTNQNSVVSLNLGGVPLQWSVAAPGQSGYFYFSDHITETPDWEFAGTDASTLQEFDGKHIETAFYGKFSPTRDPGLGQASGNAINVRVGQIVLARTVAKPDTVYVLKIHQQAQDQEAMTVRYFMWKD